MLLFGELNVFTPDDARLVLGKARAALRRGAQLLLEPHTFDAVRRMGDEPASWWSETSGLFSATPHLVLTEHAWHEEQRAATIRYYTVDATSAGVQRHAQTLQAYTDVEYHALLRATGFGEVTTYGSLTGSDDDAEPGLTVLTARAV
jgi:hypothetical protein